MQKRSLNTKGFALIAVLLTVVLVLVVAGGGAYVYHHNHKANTPVSASISTDTTSQTGTTGKSDYPVTATGPYLGFSQFE